VLDFAVIDDGHGFEAAMGMLPDPTPFLGRHSRAAGTGCYVRRACRTRRASKPENRRPPSGRGCCREVPADVIVYATGYGSMKGWVADLVDQATADKVGKVWGLGSDTPKDPGPWEGEQRNMWKPTQRVVPRRQPAPVAPLLALPRATAEGAPGGHSDARLRVAADASQGVICSLPPGLSFRSGGTP
jgi:hypothetical protein